MACLLCGSENRLVSFYSSMLGLLDISHTIENVMLEGFKKLVEADSKFGAGIVILHTGEDMRAFQRYEQMVDSSKHNLIAIVTNEALFKVIPKNTLNIVKHSLNLQPLARTLLQLNLVKVAPSANGGQTGAASDATGAAAGLEFIMEKIRNGVLTLPVKGDIAMQVLTNLERDDLSFKSIAGMTKLDPSIHAGLLKIANSVQYGGVYGSITDLEKGMVRLGINNVKVYLINYVNKALKQNKDLIFHKEIVEAIDFSFNVGGLCYVLAEHLNIPRKDDMFALGLLHRIGMIFLYAILSEHMRGKDVEDEVKLSYHTLTQDNHVSACVTLMKRWNFGDIFTLPINHMNDVLQTKLWQETKILHFSARLIESTKTGNEELLKTDRITNIMHEFKINKDILRDLIDRANKHMQEMKSLLGG